MLDIILGILLGALGGWWLTRRTPPPTAMPYAAPPTVGERGGDEERIVLPAWGAAPPAAATETSLDDISDDVAEAVAPTPPAGPAVEAYCVRCKTQRPMTNVTDYTTANGRAALKGTCPVCGAGMFTFVKE